MEKQIRHIHLLIITVLPIFVISLFSCELDSDFSPDVETDEVFKWKKTYGGSNSESGESIIETSSGDFFIVGMTSTFTSGVDSKDDMFLAKIDKTNGQLLGPNGFGNNFGGTFDDRAFDIIQKDDGGFLVVGFTESFGVNAGNGNQDRNIMVVITDSLGFQLGNEVAIGKSRNDEAYRIIRLSNGLYGVIGYGSRNGDSGSYLLTVVGSDGQAIPEFSEPKYFGLDYENDVAYDALEINQEIFIVGRSLSCDFGQQIGLLIKTNLSGIETSNSCSFTFSDLKEINSIVKTGNGIAILGRDHGSPESGVILFLNDTGNAVSSPITLSENGMSTSCYSMAASKNGTIAITGSATDNSGLQSTYLKIYNPTTSEFVATKFFTENNKASRGNRIIATNDGGFAIIGWTQTDDNEDQIYVVKTDHLGNAF